MNEKELVRRAKEGEQAAFEQLVTMYEEVCIFRKTGVIPKECQTLRDLAREIQAVTKADNIQLRMAEDALLYEMSRRYYNSLYIEQR